MRISDWSSDVCSSDLVFFPLVDGPRWARGEAGGVEAMLAQPWQIHHEGFFEVAENFLFDPFEVVIMAALLEFAAQHIFPVAAPLDLVEQRSEERRVGKECVSTCRSRWSPYH